MAKKAKKVEARQAADVAADLGHQDLETVMAGFPYALRSLPPLPPEVQESFDHAQAEIAAERAIDRELRARCAQIVALYPVAHGRDAHQPGGAADACAKVVSEMRQLLGME